MSFSCICCLLILMMTSSYGQPTDMTKWENVALNKQCNMSSSYDGEGYNNSCSTAINGNTGTTYERGNCIHTAPGDHAATWTVDLGQTYTVQMITIIARNHDYQNRLTSTNVSVDGVVVYQFPSASYTIQLTTDILQTTSGSSLPKKGQRVQLSRTDLLNICEVQVWVCRPGYYGGNCEECVRACSGKPCDDIDDPNDCPEADACRLKPCQNGGTCQRRAITAYTCSCVAGYTGTNCENDVDECAFSPCNNGTCQDGINSFSCSCYPGFTGDLCTTDIDECASNPCQHGGNCTDLINSYNCTCVPPYFGPTCQNSPAREEQEADVNKTALGAGIGGALSFLLIFVIVIVVIIFVRRRRGLTKQANVHGDKGFAGLKGTLHMKPVTSTSGRTETETSDTPPNPEQPRPVEESDVVVYEVVRENPYDQLHPYSNDVTPETDAYTSLRVTGKKGLR